MSHPKSKALKPTIDPILSSVRFRGDVFTHKDKKPAPWHSRFIWAIQFPNEIITRDHEDWAWNLPTEFHVFMTGPFTYPQIRYYESEEEALKDFHQAYRFVVWHFPENAIPGD